MGAQATPPSDPLLLLLSVSEIPIREVFIRFPELSPEVLVDRLFLHWRNMADRGAFWDAVWNVLESAPDEVRARAFPRLCEIVTSDEYSTSARALAFSTLEQYLGNPTTATRAPRRLQHRA